MGWRWRRPRFALTYRVALVLLAVLGLLQSQLWFGHGSTFDVRRMRTELASLERANTEASARNERIALEVQDLKDGQYMVEEIARLELGMVKPNEVFVETSTRPH